MKLITFTVPCYNSAAYMDRCIETLLPAGEEAEIILVDDGSTDDTGRIADEYAAKWCESITASTGVDGAEFLALAQETIAQYE